LLLPLPLLLPIVVMAMVVSLLPLPLLLPPMVE
jgi:hypothetical protein